MTERVASHTYISTHETIAATITEIFIKQLFVYLFHEKHHDASARSDSHLRCASERARVRRLFIFFSKSESVRLRGF